MVCNSKVKVVVSCSAMIALLVLCISCSTPQPSRRSTIAVDEDPLGGGIGSTEIRTIAKNMTPKLLAIPEIANSRDVTRVAISPMKNSSRFIIDMNIFMKRLRLELNKYSGGRLRFYSQRNAQVVRNSVVKERNEQKLDDALKGLAADLLASKVVQEADNPPKVALVPVLNSNLINMNADSLTALLRSHIASEANGKLYFLMPGKVDNADYYLTGQFIAKSISQQGMVNLAEYIEIVEDRVRDGKGLNLYDEIKDGNMTANNSGNQLIVNASGTPRSRLLEKIIANSKLQSKPNVTKRLNVMLVDPESKVSVFEKMIDVEKKVTQGLASANYVLSGEITGLSKRDQGKQTDYVLITVQLVDPDTNELIWENGEEVKKQSRSGIVYQ